MPIAKGKVSQVKLSMKIGTVAALAAQEKDRTSRTRPVKAGLVLAGMAVTAMVLAGCTSAPASGKATSAGAAHTPVTITFWNSYSKTDSEFSTITNKVIPAFEKANPGITVKDVTLPETNMNDKLVTDAAGGQLPNVARLDIVWEPVFASLGILQPQDALSGYKDLAAKVYPGNLATTMYKGTPYGLPLDTNTKVLLSNTKLLQEHGIAKPPTTMTAFIADIKKCTSGTGTSKVFGFMNGAGTDLWGAINWIASDGGSILNKKLTSASGELDGPKTVKAITTLVNLEKQGYATGLLPGANGDLAGLAAGQYCMIDEGPWDIPTIQQSYPKLKYTATLWPAGSGGSREPVGGEDISTFKTGSSAQQAAAWKFEQFMLSDRTQSEMQQAGQMSVLKSLPLGPSESYLKIFTQQLRTAIARPPVAKYNEIDTDISNAIGAAASGKGTAASELKQVVPQVNSLLSR